MTPVPSRTRRTGAAAAPQPLRGSGPRSAPASPGTARDSLAGFGADVLRHARGLDAAANTALSPYSLFTVLAMARTGAGGETAAQIDAALRCPGARQQAAVVTAVDAGATAALQSARAVTGAAPMSITPANRVWIDRVLDVRPEYLDALAAGFGAEATAADLTADPEAARDAINAWVAERTADLIPELFPEGSVDPSTLLVLVNALHLRAAWSQPFRSTGPGRFRTPQGEVRTPRMQAEAPLPGGRGDAWQSVSVPCTGGRLAMTVLVPDAGRFDAVLAGLDGAVIAAAARPTAQLTLTLPPFSLRSQVPAGEVVRQLGITDLFGARADLSGISARPLEAAALLHQAVITVDEQGIEVAAATGMAAYPVSGAPVSSPLVVDRPFLFWISETTTGAPLFLGAVTDPTA